MWICIKHYGGVSVGCVAVHQYPQRMFRNAASQRVSVSAKHSPPQPDVFVDHFSLVHHLRQVIVTLE